MWAQEASQLASPEEESEKGPTSQGNTLWKTFFFFYVCVPQPGIKPGPPEVEVQNLNYWASPRLFLILYVLYWVHELRRG